MNKYLTILKDLNVELNSYTTEDWSKLLEGVDKDSSGYVALEKFVMGGGTDFDPNEDYDPMSLETDVSQVMFMNRGGYESDRESALKSGLVPGGIYTIRYIDIGSWSSDVFLKEFPGQGFNTVMFKEVK